METRRLLLERNGHSVTDDRGGLNTNVRHLLVESGRFIDEKKKVRALESRLITSAVSMVEAAYWLIGGDRFTQSLVMFDGAIELLLKGELERVHPILIADKQSLAKYELLQSFVRGAFKEHPTGKKLTIPDLNIEHTIYFKDAFDRVAKLYHPNLDKWRDKLVENENSLHNLRNEIVHYGGKAKAGGMYVSGIIEVALPFIEEFLALITQHYRKPVCLSNLLFEWVYREVGVARKVLSDLRANGLPPAEYAITPLSHHILWTNSQWPHPNDDQSSIEVSAYSSWLEFRDRQKNPEGWDAVIEVDCPICGSTTRDGDYIPARVLLEDKPLDQKQLIPEGFRCLICGFEIDPSEKYLARHFVDPIPEETADAFLKDIGDE